MNGHALYTDVLTSPADDTLMPGAVVKTIVAGLLGELHIALYSLGGYECVCQPASDVVGGVPVDELERDLTEAETDRSGCVFHDTAAQDRLVVARVAEVLDRWEAPR